MTPTTRPWIPLLALTLVGGSVAYLLSSETPRGRVTGITVLRDAKGLPLSGCDVYLTPDDEEARPAEPGISSRDTRRSRHATTGPDGRFEIRGVPAGKYSLSASARRHSAESVTVVVEEARVEDRRLVLKRSEADLSIGAHQTTFGTGEKPFLPLKGYLETPPAGTSPATGTATAAKPTDTLKVRVWRTRLSDVLRREEARSPLQQLGGNGWEPVTAMPQALLNPPPGVPAPVLLSETTQPVAHADREGFFLNRVALPEAAGKPGLYLTEFTYGKKTVCSYVLVSDMALVTKRAENEILAYAVNLRTGEPLPGAQVRFYRNGQVAGSGTTGTNGVSRLTAPPLPRPATTGDGEEPEPTQEQSPLVAATRGADEAVVQGASWWYGSAGRNFVVHTLTDRTIYRPGDTVHYKGIVRRRAMADGGNGYAVPRNEPVSVEVRDAQGALVAKSQTVTNVVGTFHGDFEVSAEGDTGTYSIFATVGGEKHTADVVVASYRKPEYAVTVTPGKTRYLKGDEVEMTVEGKYYFGAPVAGATVQYYVYADADWSHEYDTSEYDADEGGAGESGSYGSYYGRTVAEGKVTLDANGRATVRFSSKPEEKEKDREKGDVASGEEAEADAGPQVEKFTLTATVEDDAKRTVEAEGAATVTAADFTLNVRPEGYLGQPGKASTVVVAARDFEGKPLADRSVTLKAEYWEWDAKNKKRVRVALPGLSPARTSVGGEAVFTLTPARNGELRLKASATDAGGRTVQDGASLWVASDGGGDLETDYDDLTLLTDKKKYEPGETARVLINSSRTGQTLLLTVEGERVHEARTLPIRQRSTVVTVPIRAEWGANVTLAACYVRSKKFASSETPIRVAQKARAVSVTVKPDRETTGPGETLTYAVTTTDATTGKPTPADFSLAVVDESIYALRADDPNALKRDFYPRVGNRVNTSHSFQVEYLGDADKSEPQIEARRKFRDTAFWNPDLRTGADGTATVRVPLPDNLTTWRATAYAVTERTAVGYGVAKTVARKPFFVRLEAPRYLTVGDDTRLLALAHNETGQAQTVTVRLTATGPAGQLALGGETKTVTVPPGGVGQAEWAVKVVNPGTARLRLTGWTPNGAGTQFTDGIETALEVRAYGRTETQTYAGTVGRPDASTVASAGATGLTVAEPGRLNLTLDNAAVPSETRLTVRVTPSVRGALAGGLEYLVGFPYGCTEQTMSRFYPDLLAQRLGVPLPKAQADKLPKMVRDGLARLRRMQKSDTGGWGWFPQGADDPFLTAYVLTGLAAARDAGYPVEEGSLRRGRDAASKMQDSAPPRLKPFLLYALALAGETDANRLRYPFRYSTVRTKLDLGKLPPDALAYLVLLAKRIGEDYRPAWAELQRRAVVEGRMIHWTTGKSGWDEFGTDRMATATALRALLAVDPRDARIPAVLRWLMASRTDGYFGDTRDTAWVITSLCEYLALNPAENAPASGRVTLSVNGQTVRTIDLAREIEPELKFNLPTAGLRPGANTVEIRPEGVSGALYYAATLRQTVAGPVETALPAIPSPGVTVKREILRVLPQKVGDGGWRLGAEDTKGKFRQGDRLRVRLVLTVTKPGSFVLIEDRFPSGCEISQRGTEEEVVESWGYWYDHVDVRDDRIAFFARQLPVGTHVIEYNLRAQTPGVSVALPTRVEGMYDPRLRAESASARVEVGK
jgi:alpha-2-macroglobulin